MRPVLVGLFVLLLSGCASKAQLTSSTDSGVQPQSLTRLTLVASDGFDPVRRPGVEQALCEALASRLQECVSLATSHLSPNRMADLTQQQLLAQIDPALYPVLVVTLDRERTEDAEIGRTSGFMIGGGMRGSGMLGFGTQIGGNAPDYYFTYQLRLLEQPGSATPVWLGTARSRSAQQPDQPDGGSLKQLGRSLQEDLRRQGWLTP